MQTIRLSLTTGAPEQDGQLVLRVVIKPGTASAEQVGAYLAEISKLYRMCGGSGISWTLEDVRVARDDTKDEGK